MGSLDLPSALRPDRPSVRLSRAACCRLSQQRIPYCSQAGSPGCVTTLAFVLAARMLLAPLPAPLPPPSPLPSRALSPFLPRPPFAGLFWLALVQRDVLR